MNEGLINFNFFVFFIVFLQTTFNLKKELENIGLKYQNLFL